MTDSNCIAYNIFFFNMRFYSVLFTFSYVLVTKGKLIDWRSLMITAKQKGDILNTWTSIWNLQSISKCIFVLDWVVQVFQNKSILPFFCSYTILLKDKVYFYECWTSIIPLNKQVVNSQVNYCRIHGDWLEYWNILELKLNKYIYTFCIYNIRL